MENIKTISLPNKFKKEEKLSSWEVMEFAIKFGMLKDEIIKKRIALLVRRLVEVQEGEE